MTSQNRFRTALAAVILATFVVAATNNGGMSVSRIVLAEDTPSATPKADASGTDNKPDAARIKPAAIPLDLKKYLNFPAEHWTEARWKAVPQGPHTFLDIPLEIRGGILLWGAENARRGASFAEKVTDIQVNRKFEMIYIYHGLFYESENGTPVYEVVFHYEDGTTEKAEIMCGDDVLDWYDNLSDTSPTIPLDARSKMAWHGQFQNGDKMQRLRFCLTGMENPKAHLEVKSIDLVSRKAQSSSCILAITTGRAGLIP